MANLRGFCVVVSAVVVALTRYIYIFNFISPGSSSRNGHRRARSKQFSGKNEDHREPERRLVTKRPRCGIGEKRLLTKQQTNGNAKR